MKYQISRDARPKVRMLLVAAIVSVLLWAIPFAGIVTYPFRLFVTFIHEGGHALAAILTGNSVGGLSVAMSGEGLTWSTQGGVFSQMLVSSAGYLSAIAFGALLLLLIRKSISTKFILWSSAVIVTSLTVVFGFWAPLSNGNAGMAAGIPFTFLAGLAIAAGLVAVAVYGSQQVRGYFVSFLAVQSVLNALFDLKTVLSLSSPFAPSIPNDAVNMSAATGIPAILWTLLWIAISIGILAFAMRCYTVCTETKDTQQDLPFEEPA